MDVEMLWRVAEVSFTAGAAYAGVHAGFRRMHRRMHKLERRVDSVERESRDGISAINLRLDAGRAK